MTADVKPLHPEPLLPGTSNAEVARLTAMYEAELRSIGAEPPPAPPGLPRDPSLHLTAEDDEKRFATLQAQAALVGVQLHRIDGDDGRPLLVATKWAMSASFDGLDAAAAWLQRFAGVKVE